MRIPLEDLLQDVIGKARRGLRLSEAQLVQKAGITFEQLEGLQAGVFEPAALAKVAGVLDLEPRALLDLGQEPGTRVMWAHRRPWRLSTCRSRT